MKVAVVLDVMHGSDSTGSQHLRAHCMVARRTEPRTGRQATCVGRTARKLASDIESIAGDAISIASCILSGGRLLLSVTAAHNVRVLRCIRS